MTKNRHFSSDIVLGLCAVAVTSLVLWHLFVIGTPQPTINRGSRQLTIDLNNMNQEPSNPTTQPKVTWRPSSLSRTVLAGDTITVPLAFISSEDITDAAILVDPHLMPHIYVSPTSFRRIAKGQTTNLGVTISAPVDSPANTLVGTIQLERGYTAPKSFVASVPLVVQVKPSLMQKVNPAVTEALTAKREVPVVVALTEPASLHKLPVDAAAVKREVALFQDKVLAEVDASAFRVRIKYTNIPALAGTVTRDGLAKLAAHPNVLKIDLDVGGGGR